LPEETPPPLYEFMESHSHPSFLDFSMVGEGRGTETRKSGQDQDCGGRYLGLGDFNSFRKLACKGIGVWCSPTSQERSTETPAKAWRAHEVQSTHIRVLSGGRASLTRHDQSL
jgi:hypothetical protein